MASHTSRRRRHKQHKNGGNGHTPAHPAPHANENLSPLRIGVIGAAASGIIETAHLVAEIVKTNPTRPVEIVLLDPQGVNAGPAYRFSGSHSILNQPAGAEMNPFPTPINGQISFLEWLNNQHPEAGYTKSSFVPRSLFGEYLLDIFARTQAGAQDAGNITITQQKTRVDDIIENDDGGFLLDCEGKTENFDAVVLATGHNFQHRLDNHHNRYTPAYADIQFEQTLARIVTTSTPETVTTLIGSGGSMSDVVGTLAQSRYRGDFRVISPYGNTSWPYDPAAAAPSQTKSRDLTNEINRRLSSWGNKQEPADFIRSLLDYGDKKAIPPQYVIVGCMHNERFRRDDALLKALRTFYGNPLCPKRHALLRTLEESGRLNFDIARVEEIAPRGDNALALKLKGRRAETIFGDVIDCACTLRGTLDANGNVANPLIAKIIKNELAFFRDRLGTFSQDSFTCGGLFVVGPPTNPDKNGIETFGKGAQAYGEIAKQVVSFLSSQTAATPALRSPRQLAQLINH